VTQIKEKQHGKLFSVKAKNSIYLHIKFQNARKMLHWVLVLEYNGMRNVPVSLTAIVFVLKQTG